MSSRYPHRDSVGCIEAVTRPLPKSPKTLAPELALTNSLLQMVERHGPGKFHASELTSEHCRMHQAKQIGGRIKVPLMIGKYLVTYVRGWFTVSERGEQ